MKTAIVWDEIGGAPIRFFVVDKDLSAFDEVYINSAVAAEVLTTALYAEMYRSESDHYMRYTPCTKDEFCAAIKDGAKLIVAGFMP